MKISLWGARGGVSVVRPETRRYGVNTPCIQVECPGADTLVLDGGIGLHSLGNALLAESFGGGKGKAHLFFSHTHWSHIQGVPFFVPLLIPGNSIHLYGRAGLYGMQKVLCDQMNPAYCPVPDFFDDAIGAQVEVSELGESPIRLGSLLIGYAEIGQVHGSPRLGYRISDGMNALAYVPAVEYLDDAVREAARALANDADLLIHDAYYSDEEYPTQRGRGHSCPRQALELAQSASAKRLLLFNHHPERSDQALDEVANALNSTELPVECGRERGIYALEER